MPSGPESGSPVYGYGHRQYSQNLPQPVPLFSTDYAGHLRHAPIEHDIASPPTAAPHHRDCPSPHGCSNCIHTPPAKISENPLSHRSRQTNLSHSPPRKKTDNNFPSSDNHDSPPSKQRSEEHTSELQSRFDHVCRLLLEKKKKQMMF